MKRLQWNAAAPGVWKSRVGSPKGLTPLTYLNAAPKMDGLSAMSEAEFPMDERAIGLEPYSSGYILTIPLEESERLYGTGLQFMRMNQRGRSRYLRVNSDPKQDTGETHAPVPFVISDKGFGVLIDTSRIVTLYCGSTVKRGREKRAVAKDRNSDNRWLATPVSDRMEIQLPPDGADIYIFGGPTMLDAVRRYNLYCGGGTLPPKWGLGFWHRTPTLYSAEEVYAEAMEFRRRNFPCDVIGLEPGWHSTSYPVTYEWSRERYPNPAAFVAMMKERGFRINLWEHPYVSTEAGIYNKIKALSGTHTVWGGVVPDYSLTEASELYMSQHDKEHVEIGVSGYKLDECDGSELTRNSWMFPAHASFPSGHDGEQMRQLYGLMFQKMTADLFERHNLRTYGLVRASNAGASPLPYVLYSDLYDHRQFVRALCNASFCGLLWTPEVRKANDVEDWVRRMQTVCFSPLAMLNAWGDGTKPWTYPEAEHIIRHYIKLRTRLLPYLYSEFAKYEQSGVPPFRAMPLVLNSTVCNYATDGGRGGLNTTDAAYGRNNEKDWDDQYMVGDALLVAPLFAGETGRDVLLPEGVWFGLETGERFEGGGIVRFEAELEQFPLFVREGTILPLMPAYDSIPESGTKIPIELVHFGSAPGEFHLYDDDGVTCDFKQGRRSWCKLSVSRAADGKYLGESHIVDESYFGYEIVKWHFEQTKLPL